MPQIPGFTLEIFRGLTLRSRFQLIGEDNSTPIDLTGCTVLASIWPRDDKDAKVDLSASTSSEIGDEANGFVTLSATRVETDGLAEVEKGWSGWFVITDTNSDDTPYTFPVVVLDTADL